MPLRLHVRPGIAGATGEGVMKSLADTGRNAAAAVGVGEYTCPMHPEIVRNEPGSCPICGMALEPRTVTLDEGNPELVDMTRRFWVSTALSVPAVVLAMGEYLPGHLFETVIPASAMSWVQMAI